MQTALLSQQHLSTKPEFEKQLKPPVEGFDDVVFDVSKLTVWA